MRGEEERTARLEATLLPKYRASGEPSLLGVIDAAECKTTVAMFCKRDVPGFLRENPRPFLASMHCSTTPSKRIAERMATWSEVIS